MNSFECYHCLDFNIAGHKFVIGLQKDLQAICSCFLGEGGGRFIASSNHLL